MKKEYIGKLVYLNNGEEDDILGLERDEEEQIFTELLQDELYYFLPNKYATVRYYISDVLKSIEEIQTDYIKKVLGSLEVDYGIAYSEYTGYLWTTEELKVGGHDLLEELKDNVDKYLYMEIEIND